MMTSSEGIFSTIHFRPSQLAKMKKLSKTYAILTQRPVHISFEQRGDSSSTIGKEPHLHILQVTTTPAKDENFIKNHFGNVSSDIVTKTKTPYLMADLLFRYLRGFKKEYIEKPAIRAQTRKWIAREQLEPISTRGITRRVRYGIPLSSYRSVLERSKLYA